MPHVVLLEDEPDFRQELAFFIFKAPMRPALLPRKLTWALRMRRACRQTVALWTRGDREKRMIASEIKGPT